MCSIKIKTYVHALWFFFPYLPPKNKQTKNKVCGGDIMTYFFYKKFLYNKAEIWSNECESMGINVYEMLSLNFLNCIHLHYLSSVVSLLHENVYLDIIQQINKCFHCEIIFVFHLWTSKVILHVCVTICGVILWLFKIKQYNEILISTNSCQNFDLLHVASIICQTFVVIHHIN